MSSPYIIIYAKLKHSDLTPEDVLNLVFSKKSGTHPNCSELCRILRNHFQGEDCFILMKILIPKENTP